MSPKYASLLPYVVVDSEGTTDIICYTIVVVTLLTQQVYSYFLVSNHADVPNPLTQRANVDGVNMLLLLAKL